jgi:dTDP-4-dehydrorhamnose reductase
MPPVMKLHLLLLRVQWGKKSKIAHQDHQLDLSNHEQLKKMAAAHYEIVVVAKKQQESLDSQNENLQCLADNAIMNKDLTNASDMVKQYYEIQRKKIMDCLEAKMGKATE